MDNSAKRHIMRLMATAGHRHQSMTDTLRCGTCSTNFKKAKREYTRLQKKDPKLFTREKPTYQNSAELNDMTEQLADRLKRDPLYKKHIELSFKGTPAERKREHDRANSGYYTKHSEYQPKW